MIATSALGLGIGIDMKRIVLVVCWNPKGMMEMLQMFGRAGRDGGPATGIMLSSGRITEDLQAYCRAKCRQDAALQYLDEKGMFVHLGVSGLCLLFYSSLLSSYFSLPLSPFPLFLFSAFFISNFLVFVLTSIPYEIPSILADLIWSRTR
jgi:hypothetical protein